MEEQRNLMMVKQAYDSFLKGDINGILDILDETVEWKEPVNGPKPFSGTYRGRDEVANLFKNMFEVVNLLAFEAREYIADKNNVVVLGYYKFQSKKTKKEWETDWVMVWKFENDKIKTFQVYKDSAAELIGMQKESVKKER